MIEHFGFHPNWSYFSEKCDQLKLSFSRQKYTCKLINSTVSRFIAAKGGVPFGKSKSEFSRFSRFHGRKERKIREKVCNLDKLANTLEMDA